MNNRLLSDIRQRYNKLTSLIEKTESKIRQLPEGRVKVKNIKGKTYYYLVTDTGERILSSFSDMSMANDLVQKSYLHNVLTTANQEQQALKKALDGYPRYIAEEIYLNLSDGRRKLVDPIVQSDDEFIRSWLSTPYEPKEIDDGYPLYMTSNGERVRSKSEVIIADHLRMHEIPYKYECPLALKRGGIIYPDFTILKVSTRTILYLEHCGKMGDSRYEDRNALRNNTYIKNGILPGRNLFMTFESDRNPLDIEALDIMIDKMFR